MQPHTLAFQRMPTPLHNLSDFRVEGIREPDMAHDAAVEEGEGAHALGAIDDLVRHDEVAGPNVLLQRADGAEGDDAAHAQRAQGGEVGAVGDFVGRE
jgi:hypothetical protein